MHALLLLLVLLEVLLAACEEGRLAALPATTQSRELNMLQLEGQHGHLELHCIVVMEGRRSDEKRKVPKLGPQPAVRVVPCLLAWALTQEARSCCEICSITTSCSTNRCNAE